MKTISKKVCLLGDFAVGKTSLVRRFIHNRFDDKYISTIGVKVSRKTVTVTRVDEMVELTMMLWDLAGNEEFSRMRTTYLRGSTGAVLVCDLTRPETLDSLYDYAADLWRISPDARLVLAANKNDLFDEHQLTPDQIEAVAIKLNSLYYPTSAKTGEQVESLFRRLGQWLVS